MKKVPKEKIEEYWETVKKLVYSPFNEKQLYGGATVGVIATTGLFFGPIGWVVGGLVYAGGILTMVDSREKFITKKQ